MSAGDVVCNLREIGRDIVVVLCQLCVVYRRDVVRPEHQLVVIAGKQGHILKGCLLSGHLLIAKSSIQLRPVLPVHHIHAEDTAVDLTTVAGILSTFHRRAACGHRCGKRYCHFLAGGQTEAGLFPLAGNREQCHDCRGDCQ